MQRKTNMFLFPYEQIKVCNEIVIKYNLITPLIGNCSISVTLEFTRNNCSFIFENNMSQNLIENNHLHNFKCLVIPY